MTAISTLISKRGISFATDSLLTTYLKSSKTHKILDYTQSKIIPAEKYHAAIAYYGFAKCGSWSFYDWIKRKIAAYGNSLTLEEFSVKLENDLKQALSSFFRKFDLDSGIGLHIAGYENKGNVVLPELYHICNFTDTTYKKVGEMSVGPQLYGTLPTEYKSVDDDTIDKKKQKINQFLEEGRLFIFNNGDPELFNPFSNAFFTSFMILQARKKTKYLDLDAQRAITRRPIEMIKNAQIDFFLEGKILIGGKIHDLTIDKSKKYKSTTGDI